MSVARARALTLASSPAFAFTDIVEMSVARARALTHAAGRVSIIPFFCRNECCPCEGIDTALYLSHAVSDRNVEMSVARARALTHIVGEIE